MHSLYTNEGHYDECDQKRLFNYSSDQLQEFQHSPSENLSPYLNRLSHYKKGC